MGDLQFFLSFHGVGTLHFRKCHKKEMNYYLIQRTKSRLPNATRQERSHNGNVENGNVAGYINFSLGKLKIETSPGVASSTTFMFLLSIVGQPHSPQFV